MQALDLYQLSFIYNLAYKLFVRYQKYRINGFVYVEHYSSQNLTGLFVCLFAKVSAPKRSFSK